MTVQSQIQDLVRQRTGKHVDTVSFVDQLLAVVKDGGRMRCTLAGTDRLRFDVHDQDAFEVSLDLAKSKLRSMCARLAVLCNESGLHVSFYGGAGIIKKKPSGYCARSEPRVVNPRSKDSPSILSIDQGLKTWIVRFQNTTDAQEFTIEAQ